jgi:hypothetical protein
MRSSAHCRNKRTRIAGGTMPEMPSARVPKKFFPDVGALQQSKWRCLLQLAGPVLASDGVCIRRARSIPAKIIPAAEGVIH